MYTLLFSSQRRLWPSLGPQRLEPLEAQAEARGAPEAGAGPSSPPRLGKASSLAPCHLKQIIEDESQFTLMDRM